MMNEIAVPAGTNIIVGILACNQSQKIWGEDANEWKPERWLSPLPRSVEDAHVPGIYSNLYVCHVPNCTLLLSDNDDVVVGLG